VSWQEGGVVFAACLISSMQIVELQFRAAIMSSNSIHKAISVTVFSDLA
jgi:hypothetical protein